MEKFEGNNVMKIAIWNQANIDTDMIIPSDFLKVTKVEGLGVHLFDGLRFLDKGELYSDPKTRKLNPDFFLNEEMYKGAEILIVGENFGCGSSREHAPWALKDYGFKVIIATSFADIFYENSFKNGLLLIQLPYLEVNLLLEKLNFYNDNNIVINLEKQLIIDLIGNRFQFSFEIDSLKKKILLEGLDEIDITLEEYNDYIVAFKANQKQKYPWI